MKSIRLALAQILPEPGMIAWNAKRIISYLETAAEKKAAFLIFPECSLSGYSIEPAEKIAVSENDPMIRKIREISAQTGTAVCFGYIERTEKGLYITQELTADGQTVKYRKTHLGTKEKAVFLQGDSFPVSQKPVCTGIQLCWESHIPEISTAERRAGAELLIVPYASPMSGDRCRKNWDIHLPARASDNGVFTAACNLLFRGTSSDADIRGGGLALYDPKGVRIAENFSTEETMIIADLKGPLPRETSDDNMHFISYFDRKRTELFR